MCVCECTPCVYRCLWRPEEGVGALVMPHVGSGNPLQLLWKGSKHSALRHLSIP